MFGSDNRYPCTLVLLSESKYKIWDTRTGYPIFLCCWSRTGGESPGNEATAASGGVKGAE